MAQEQDIEDNRGKMLLQGLWDTLSQQLVWKGKELRVEGRLQDCRWKVFQTSKGVTKAAFF